jgi:hypothetical protein
VPVDPDKIADISKETVGLYRAAEQAILIDVTKRLAKGMDAPDWAVRRLGALSTLRGTVQAILDLVLNALATSIRSTLAAAWRLGAGAALLDLPAQLLPRNSDTVNARQRARAEVPRARLIENLAQALVVDVGAKHSNIVRDVADAYRKVIAEATAVSIAGGMTRRQASQHAYQKLIDQGLTGFVDKSGRRWRLSSYVEMAVRTVTQRAAIQGQVDKQLAMGQPFGIVSDHVQECEICRPFENRILRLDDGPTGRIEVIHQLTKQPTTITVAATVEQARARGLWHPGCRHGMTVYIPGVTKKLAKETADPEGDAARQRQRAIERQIRHWKERRIGALDPVAEKQAGAKVRAWQKALRDHLAANPKLKRLTYREQIGAGNIPDKLTRDAAKQVRTSQADPGSRSQPEAVTGKPEASPTSQPETQAPAYADRLSAAAGGAEALGAAPYGLRKDRPAAFDLTMSGAVREYTGAEYAAINAHLRGTHMPYGYEAEDVLPTIDGLDAAFAGSKLARDVVVWRGMTSAAMFGDRVDGDLTGLEWREEAFSSTSASEAKAKMFATGAAPVVMRVLVPAGTGAVEASGMGLEAELLLERGLRLRVVADNGVVDGKRRLDVEVVR